MSTLRVAAALEAAATGRAAPVTTVRHVHLADRPLVLIPLSLAGEACAPLAAMVGTDRDAPVLLTVPNPKDRTDRFHFAARLAGHVLPYCETFATDTESYEYGRGKARELRERSTDAPQLIVPNRAGVGFLRLLGRSTRFRRTEGPYAVDPAVPRLGQWLSWFTDQNEFPTSSLCVGLTQMLTAHWATGQSPTEDAHLPALMGWIDPPPDTDGPTAARQAEDPSRFPPAGPTTDPVFDGMLTELYTAIGQASSERRRAAAIRQLEEQLRTQLLPTWRLMWRGLDLLEERSAGRSVASRWQTDRDRFTGFAAYVADGGLPQGRWEHASGAARRLARLEDAADRYASERAFDDPLVMAEYELTGEAVVGVVTVANPSRTVVSSSGRRLLRPSLTLTVPHSGRLRVGDEVRSPARTGQKAEVLAIRRTEEGPYEIDFELSGGMGRSQRPPPPPGTVPELGDEVCYTSLSVFTLPAALPDDASTPWTHGGPPQPHAPTDDDANEAWE
ncbi:hypothetical protein [Streptomyces liliifuscus]|uniref:Uncharacterized protein n=1 Tax=Streptomyces liliifuscus TaxID=2797636 RepID=A0A7T7KZK2_9ACTN|nr:hypothetical protein [Streptomyces liliifuscus]QQM43683.1 hypothetical protein JEQ17_32735 [Streptomyces liliifuscus]